MNSSKRQEIRDKRQEIRDKRQETRIEKREAGSVAALARLRVTSVPELK